MNNRLMNKINGYSLITISLLFIIIRNSSAENDDISAYSFNPDFFVGDNNVDLNRFKYKNRMSPGNYDMAININGTYIGHAEIKIADSSGSDGSIICAEHDVLSLIDLKDYKRKLVADNKCISLQTEFPYLHYIIDSTNFSVNIEVPQIYLNRVLRGETDDRLWDEGINAGFVNYNMNYYENNQNNSYEGGNKKYASFFALFNSGVNVGLWQFRHNANYTNSQNGSSEWSTLNSYVQRPLSSIKSHLVIGEYNSSGLYLDSLNFKGIQLTSDDRMLPDSQQGFAPVVRGIAQSNATVEVSQRGTLLYKTSVPQGPFMIDDLYPTGYGGDLDVLVNEADGTTQRFSVPYSSTAQLLRDGLSRYSLTVGQLNDSTLKSEPKFIQGLYSKGLSNTLTGYVGSQLSENYQATVTGAAINSNVGSFSLDITNSFAKINQGDEKKRGWSIKASHSQLFELTDTYLSLSTYRFSSEDYYNFNNAARGYESSLTAGFNQKARFELSLNQPVNDNGSLFFSGSRSSYWDQEKSVTSYQGGYNFHYHNINVGVILSRVENSQNKNENRYSLTMSIPFGSESSGYNNITTSFSSSDSGDSQTTVGFNGVSGIDSHLSYGISNSYDSKSKNSISANLTKNYSQGRVIVSGSKGKNYDQYSAGLSGSMLLHSGGLTLGQYTSESMALIEADHAYGARVENTSGVTIDRFGYAVVPYINPFRSNEVSINAEGISEKTELKGTSKKVIPYSGSIVKVKFKTVTGNKAFIFSQKPNGDNLPIGSLVTDEQGADIGMVGQGGVIYASGLADKGLLKITWSQQINGSCMINYDLSRKHDVENYDGLYNLSLPCLNIEK